MLVRSRETYVALDKRSTYVGGDRRVVSLVHETPVCHRSVSPTVPAASTISCEKLFADTELSGSLIGGNLMWQFPTFLVRHVLVMLLPVLLLMTLCAEAMGGTLVQAMGGGSR